MALKKFLMAGIVAAVLVACGDGNGTDVYAFSALPAGYGGSLNYSDAGYSAGFWGSSENYDGNLGYNITLDNYKVANQNYDSKLNGFSVRCVKD